jgi:serine/threonine protein kinase
LRHVPKIDIFAFGLEKKYRRLAKILGEGGGGSVQLVNRHTDGAVFAVKKFKMKSPIKDETEYTRKIIVEFGVGLWLQHGNIIKTLELFQDGQQWYEVMEYAPYSLFDCVIGGKMSTAEMKCSFLQVLAGVSHLHEQGFAHRDLKFENVIISEKGIMKIIDFGNAVMCRHPLAKNVVPATSK